MKISMIGSGYVGLTTGTCFAELGNDVLCVDIDEAKIKNLNKGILPILWELFPGHPNLLECYFNEPKRLTDYVKKPLLSREGANLTIQRGASLQQTEGPYGAEGFVCQAVARIPNFDGAHPVHAALGSQLVARFISWRHGMRLSDIAPFRAIRLDLLRRLDMQDRAYGWPVEMVAKAAARGARIIEVPVSHAPRQAGRSKVSGTLVGSLRASYAFLVVTLRASRRAA